MVRSYRDLIVWQRAMDLVALAYEAARTFPPAERFELSRQLQRAAVSIPANIAEGHARIHRGDYLHHLSFALGSLTELETHLAIAERLGYVASQDVAAARELADHVGRMLTSLIRRLRGSGALRGPAARAPRAPSPEPL